MEVLGILAITIVAPIAIVLHYVTRWKQMNTLTGEDESILTELWDSAERIEKRITNIERILDAEDTDWRNK